MEEPEKKLDKSSAFSERRAGTRALAVAIDRTDNAVLIMNRDSRIQWANSGFERLSGYTLNEVKGLRAQDLLQGPHTAATDAARLTAAREAGRPVIAEILNYHKDGHPYWVEIDVQPVIPREGREPESFVAIQRDITQRKYTEALNTARAATLESLAAGKDLPIVLRALVDGLGMATMEMYISILLLDDTQKRLYPVTGPGLPAAYMAALEDLPVAEGVGSCGTAAYRCERVITPDIRADPLWAPYQHLAELSGMRACWSEPIRGLDGQVLGTFALYYPAPRTPSEAEASFIEQAAEVAGMAVERKSFESRLAAREKEVRALFDNAAEGIYRSDVNGRFTEVNRAMAHMHGCDNPEEFLAHFGEGRHAYYADQESWSRIAEELRKSGAVTGIECQVRHRDGSVFWVAESVRAVTDEGGRTIGYEGFTQDISERKHANQELESFKRVLDNTVDQIFMVDAETLRFVYMNRSALENTGYTEEEMRVLTPTDVNPEYPQDRYYRLIAPLLSGEKDAFHFETVHRSKDGADIPVEINLQLMGAGDGQKYLVAIARDVTEWREREEALATARDKAEEASRAKSRFLAQMSHELRTPLNAIIGFADVISERMFDHNIDVYAEYGAQIRESGTRLLGMIEDVLNMAELERGAYTLNEGRVKLPAVIAACVSEVEPLATAESISVKAQVPPDLSTLRADEEAVHQVLLSLLTNAVNYTEANSTVTVTAGELEDGGIFISVTDTGPGIPDSEIERLLAPFEKGGSVTPHIAGDQKGVGLGLAISRDLMELHGGSLKLDSSSGTGTRATITFPADRIVRNPAQR